MLPINRHIIDLIDHAEEHIKRGAEKDLKFAFIHADNSRARLRILKLEDIWNDFRPKQ